MVLKVPTCNTLKEGLFVCGVFNIMATRPQVFADKQSRTDACDPIEKITGKSYISKNAQNKNSGHSQSHPATRLKPQLLHPLKPQLLQTVFLAPVSTRRPGS